jgi:TDG/mug DNA glycosylase family protein
MFVHSFAPISRFDSRLLVLGSMPGKASVRADQYYAHPQNIFWKIMEEFFTISRGAPYATRTARLLDHGVAIWDVLQSCTRESSLDSDIVEASIVPNDFAGFLERHGEIDTVCFNGVKAATSFEKHVLPTLAVTRNIAYHRLPSTSPANASIRYATKLESWEVVRRSAGGGA